MNPLVRKGEKPALRYTLTFFACVRKLVKIDHVTFNTILTSPTGLSVVGGPILPQKPAVAYFYNGSGSTAQPNSAGSTAPLTGFGVTSTSGDATLLAAFNKSNATFTAPYNMKVNFQGMQQWTTGGLGNNYQVNLVPFNDQTKAIYTASMYQTCQPFIGTFVLNSGDTLQISGNQSGNAWGTAYSRLQITVEARY